MDPLETLLQRPKYKKVIIFFTIEFQVPYLTCTVKKINSQASLQPNENELCTLDPILIVPQIWRALNIKKKSYELNRHVILARGIKIYPVQEI